MNFKYMADLARMAAPNEACGVVAGGHTFNVANVSKDPSKYFMLDYPMLCTIYEKYGGLEAVWHSHPRGRISPSSSDLENHPDPAVPMVIIADDIAFIYDIRGDGADRKFALRETHVCTES